MGRNLIGYFGAKPNCNSFSIKIITDSANTEFDEIYLAGDSPVVVTYDTSNTPFDPIRFSRASINVVADEKFFDVFSSEAQGTRVVLTDEKNNVIEWVGYLTSNLLNMPENSCGAETFSLEAQDCLSTLENYDYQLIGGKKQIVNFRQILTEIAMRCGLINTMYVDMSMQRGNGTYINPTALTISEQNFFSSDTDEPWNVRQVLEELCRYLGYTAMQYRDGLYLYDMQSHAGFTWQTDSDASMTMNCYRYRKATGFSSVTQGSYTTLAKGVTLRQSLVRGTGADISLETLYNKVQVKDSFYEIDHFIPNIYEDGLLTNRLGDFWKSNQLASTRTFTYLNKSGYPKKEEKSEAEHIYYMRRFDHKNYTPIYRNNSLAPVVINNYIKVSDAKENQNDDQQNSTGTYSVTVCFKNTDSVAHSITLEGELTYTWWDEQHMMNDYNTGRDDATYTIDAGSQRYIGVSMSTWWDSDYRPNVNYRAWYTIDGGSHEYSIYDNNDDSTQYIGATIVDLATFDKPMSTTKYNYETEANIDFTRYLMIHQKDKPTMMHPYSNWIFDEDKRMLYDTEIETYFPAVLKLNSGYTNPMIFNDNAYLYLDASAIYERYDVPWINPDWTHDNTSMNGLGLFRKMASITTTAPCLIFKLKVGNKYWSTQSGWTTKNACFCVNLSTDKTDEDDCDFTAWWNEDHTVLNNVSWTDWAGAKGYKIPLENGMDMNQDIVFQVQMPSKMQSVKTTYSYDGMNNYCWVKDLQLKFTTKDKENYDNADVLYENIINSGSVNTLSDITCKFTTYPGNGMHSYSNVALDGVLISGMTKIGLDGVANKPEENIIKAYSNQYSTSTIKQTLTLDSSINPLSRIKDPTLGKYFGILGQTIDYAAGSQVLTLIEIKEWSL